LGTSKNNTHTEINSREPQERKRRNHQHHVPPDEEKEDFLVKEDHDLPTAGTRMLVTCCKTTCSPPLQPSTSGHRKGEQNSKKQG